MFVDARLPSLWHTHLWLSLLYTTTNSHACACYWHVCLLYFYDDFWLIHEKRRDIKWAHGVRHARDMFTRSYIKLLIGFISISTTRNHSLCSFQHVFSCLVLTMRFCCMVQTHTHLPSRIHILRSIVCHRHRDSYRASRILTSGHEQCCLLISSFHTSEKSIDQRCFAPFVIGTKFLFPLLLFLLFLLFVDAFPNILLIKELNSMFVYYKEYHKNANCILKLTNTSWKHLVKVETMKFCWEHIHHH